MLSMVSPSPFLRSPPPPSTKVSGRHSAPPNSIRFRASAVNQFAPPSTCLYQVLGIPVGSSGEDIKAAYRRLARTFHPDVAADSPADDFVRINTAYSTLSDPEKRADYDRRIFQRQRPYRAAVVSLSQSKGCYGYTCRNWETDQCW